MGLNGLISWFLLGLIAGAVAKFLMPGNQKGGCLLTSVLGIVGALVGGFIGTQLGWGKVDEFDLRSIGLAVVGSLVVLLVFRAIGGKG